MEEIIPEGSTRAYDRTSYILIVDDDNTLLKFFKIHLNKFFSKVIVVKNAKEAMDAIKEKEIDLVMSDIRMPRVDGIALVRKIRKHNPSIPLLLVSGALLSEEQEIAVSEADGFLRKPFSVDDLHDFINRGLDLRESMKKIFELVSNKKKFMGIMDGSLTAREVAKKANLEEVEKAVAELKKVG